MTDELKVVIQAAKAGAKAALKYFNTNPSFVLKADNTPVTKADKESEEVIKKVILSRFSDAKFLAEESGGDVRNKNMWVIDPLDGTRSFIRHVPFWSVLVSYIYDGEIVVGVSYCPLLNECIYAEKGKGTFLNGKKVGVSAIDTLSQAFLNHGSLPYFGKHLDRVINLLEKVYRARGYADFYGYHLVASGKADVMLDAKNGPWDITALKIIVEEAGGKVTNFEGKSWKLTDPITVATNGLLHDQVIKILNE